MKQNILIIQQTLCGGGAEKVLTDILSHFDYSKYNVNLLLYIKAGVYLQNLDKRVRIISMFECKLYDKIYRNIAMKLYSNFGCKTLLKRRLKRLQLSKFDTIISFMEGASLVLQNILWDKAARNISWVHTDMISNHWTKHYFYKDDESKIYNTLDAIVFVSNDTLLKFEKLFPSVKVNKLVINNLILRNDIKKRAGDIIPIDKHKFTVISVGRLTPPKSFDLLIKTAKIIQDKGYDIDFWIVGAGELESKLKALSHNLDLDNSVHFLGYKNNPYPYIANSDIYLSTSKAEGFSIAICEAMCIGKPVISTISSGPKEILDGGKYGILTTHDEQSLAHNIIKLMENEDLAAHFANQSLTRACSFNITNTMNKIYSLVDISDKK